jgi:hypothetical protein
MANCEFLLNDGTRILLNDGTSILLMNDDTCGAAGEEAPLHATGTVTTTFINGSFTEQPVPFAMTGTASVSFASSFDSVPPPPLPALGAGGARAWHNRYREDGLERVRRAYLLALIR